MAARLRLVLLVLAATLAPAAAARPGENVAENFARPALRWLMDESTKLAVAAQGLCAAPGPETLRATRLLFGETVRAFGRASVLRFGPLSAENRFERLFFWPDPQGAALQQVQDALASEDPGLADVGVLASKSAALQGFPALEFALFGTGSDELAKAPAGYRCRFTAAVAGNIGFRAVEAEMGWERTTPFAQSFEAPAPDREPYRSADEVNSEIVKALAAAIRFIRAAELQPPLGATTAEADGKRAPLWRSNLSFLLITAQIEGIRDMLLAAGFADMLPASQNRIPGQLRFGLDAARRALEQVDAAPELAFKSEEDRGRIGFANLALDGVGDDIAKRLSPALGLAIDFNGLVGD